MISKYLCLTCIPAAITGAGISTHYMTRSIDDMECGRINSKLLESNIIMCAELNKLGKHQFDCNGVKSPSK